MSTPIKRAFHDTPLGQIHYRYILTSNTPKKAPIIFLHQTASCGWVYQNMMKEYAERGHDCYAPDMPGFGASYDPIEDPKCSKFYVDVFMGLFRDLKLPKFHLVGHHTGAGLAMEIAALYPDEIFSVMLSAPALATPTEQAAMFKTLAGEWSKPKHDGSHLMKVWDVMNGELWGSLEVKNHEVLDTLRAWRGRDQAYGVMFRQEKLRYFREIRCPILATCSKQDVLWPCFHYCTELQQEARCEVTSGNFLMDSKDVEGSIAYHHMDFLDKLGL
ncbi:Alpha/Beta hydrolase protein [Halenospora varia]|nr:Alpha/Beta hydrolase protein [Halenospora varia]